MKTKPVYFWTALDVQHWLKKCLPELFDKYGVLLNNHEITGRALITMTGSCLISLGVKDPYDRHILLHHFLKLKMLSDTDEFQEMLDNNEFTHF